MKIKSIKEIQPRIVYAIHTSTNTFISNGLAHHNCYSCNVCNHGEQLEYYYAMQKLGYTEDEIIKMRQLRYTALKYTAEDYEEIAEKYKEKSAQLQTAFLKYGGYSPKVISLVSLPHAF